MKRIATLENRFEADLVTATLEAEGIEYFIKTFEDSAYDGIFVTQKGYALLLVNEEDQDRARAVVEDVRTSASDDLTPEDES